MSFLSPWFLLGLLGIGIPLAIHLIHRQRAERILLPTVRFLKSAPKKQVHFQMIQQWLLLGVRAAIVALLAFAFARPILSGASPKRLGYTPQTLVIALDTSMSMGYGDRFQEAKAAVIDRLTSLQPVDEAAIITFSDRTGPIHPLTTDHAALTTFVQTLPPPDHRPTHFVPAFRLADQILRSANTPEQTICMVSDFQRSAVSDYGDPWTMRPGIRFESVQIGDAATSNLAVADVTVTALPTDRDESHKIVGRIKNAGNRQAEEARVWLEIDGRQVADRRLDLAAGAEQVVTFPITVIRPGLHSGVLMVQGDRFERDNQHFFTFVVEPPRRVLLVSDNSSQRSDAGDASVWFHSALEGHPDAMFQVDVRAVDEFRPDALAAYAAVVLMDIDALEPAQTSTLVAYAKGGGGVLLAPADGVDSDAFNRTWAAISPALLRRKEVLIDGGALAITRLEERHAIVRALQMGETATFGAARFHGYWVTDPAAESTVILGFDNGHAALVEKSAGLGRVLLFTSSLDPVWSNFPRQVMYLPMLHAAVRYLTGDRDEPARYVIGEIAPLKIPADSVVRITSPLGRETLLPATPDGTAFFDATDEPGIYETQAGNRTGRFSVNVSARESDFTPLSATEIRNRVSVSPYGQAVPDTAPSPRRKGQQETSQQHWWWLLSLVLGLAFFETYLANRTYR
ncbi:MAG: BatA domain-containing protein [Desulfosarcinaceae bacterium]|nr:BatA domain-containing protein [Desulfosarcinaceae bacterium]